jgi:DUF4097 and DUF4098 domain-containing protein YvlB
MNAGLKYLIIGGVILIAGCAFNVREDNQVVSLQTSSEDISSIQFYNDIFATRDIAVQGIQSESLFVSTVVRRMVLDGQDANDNLSLSMGADGTIRFNYSGEDWEALELDKLSLRLDRSTDLKLSSITGDIEVAGMLGFLTVTNTTGDIALETARGCKVTSTTGDIGVTVVPDGIALDSVIVTVTTGDIDISVPTGLRARLDLKTTTGDIEWPDGSTESSLNGGGSTDPLILCRATTGDVTIVQR